MTPCTCHHPSDCCPSCRGQTGPLCPACATPLESDHEQTWGACDACAERYGCETCGELVRDADGELVEGGKCPGCGPRRNCPVCDRRLTFAENARDEGNLLPPLCDECHGWLVNPNGVRRAVALTRRLKVARERRAS